MKENYTNCEGQPFGSVLLLATDSVQVKVSMRGTCLRQTTKMPDVVVFSTDDYVVMHPMSEPGRDAGNTNYRATHFMLIKRNETGAINSTKVHPING